VPQSLRPHERPEFRAPSTLIPLGMRPGDSTRRLEFSCHQSMAATTCMSTYLCRLY
jgi:hypothetical protein